jgi:cobalt transporter subunit CbtA
MVFRNIVLSAVIVGALAGLVYGLFQQLQVSPIIYGAEHYEVAEEAAPAGHEAHEHEHAAEAWAPADGIERVLFTLGADSLVGISYALVLIALMAFSDFKSTKPKVNAMRGIVWGIAGFVTFFIATALFGLHPEVPGTNAAALDARQLWWALTAMVTAAGLAILYYAPIKFKLGGLLLIAIPHFIGAPLPTVEGFGNTESGAVAALTQLSEHFLVATTITAAIFWVVLGGLSGFAVKRFVKIG